MAVVEPGASVFVKAFRVSGLTEEGAIAPGATTVVTKDGMKLNISPTLDTGDDIAIKNANGDLATLAKHGDMIKYYTVQLELAKPDPQLEQLCCGGALLGTTTSTLGTAGSPTSTTANESGELASKTYAYAVSFFNSFGEGLSSAELPVVTTGAKGVNVIIPAAYAGTGLRVYGRETGAPFFIGTIPNIGTAMKVKTTITVGKYVAGEVFTLEIENVGKVGIPAGSYLKVAGTTVFKTLAYIGASTTSVLCETANLEGASKSTVWTAAETIKAVFVDYGGTKTTLGTAQPVSVDSSALTAENIGVSAPALGPVGNPTGVSIEAWSYNYIEGAVSATLPYWWWALPRVRHMHIMPRDLTNANTATLMEGIAVGNTAWGTGPTGEWPTGVASASRAWQRIRCGAQVVPTPSYSPQIATV